MEGDKVGGDKMKVGGKEWERMRREVRYKNRKKGRRQEGKQTEGKRR